MQSIYTVVHRHLPPPLVAAADRHPHSSLRSLLSVKPFVTKKTIVPLSASHNSQNSSNKNKTNQSPLLSFIYPSLLTLATAAAALFASQFRNPPPSLAAITVDRSETVTEKSDLQSDSEKEKLLEEYLETNPEDTRALRSLMGLKVQSGDLPAAIAIADRIIPLEPESTDAQLLKSHLQTYSGDTESAKVGFEDLLARDPMRVEAYHGLIMAANESGDGAEDELDRILKRVEAAIEMCKKEKRKEDLRDFKLLVAQVKVVQGKYEEALKVYKELNREEPKDFRPYLCQGIVYTLLRKKDEAEKHFEKYRRLVPKGHPYAQYFDENMVAMKVFSQIDENKRKGALKN